jgi:hypothetical protein
VALDAVLVVLLVFAIRLLAPAAPGWGQPFQHAADWLLALVLFAWRDVVGAASPAKWLLCLRLETRDGGRPGFLPRLLRAPLSLLPLFFLPGSLQARLRWRVGSYAPSHAGLVLRTAAAVSAAAGSVLWAASTQRTSIPPEAARDLAAAHVAADAPLRRALGEPVASHLGSIARRFEQHESGTATFWLHLRGARARQDMLVHARKVDGVWVVEELSDIEIQPLRPGEPEIAER